ncbi:MAG: hypothetical protein ACPG7F_06840 [Aggregatilineales bacterium]
MQLIALTGMMILEKADLCIALAQHFGAAGQRVCLLDNLAGTDITGELPAGVMCHKIMLDNLPGFVVLDPADIFLLAVSERAHPDTTVQALLNLEIHEPALTVQTIALIDARSEGCFPQVVETLIQNADVSLHLPATLDDILEVM